MTDLGEIRMNSFRLSMRPLALVIFLLVRFAHADAQTPDAVATEKSAAAATRTAGAPSPAPATPAALVTPSSASATPAPPVNPRLAVIDRVSMAAMAAMAASNDPSAVALSAKYLRDANLKPEEKRDFAQKNDIQMAALMRAKQLADKQRNGLVDFQISMYCLGFPAKPLCLAGDPVREFAESTPDNAIGWLIMAAREFSQGMLVILGPYLEKAGQAKFSDWYYPQAAATALQFAKAVVEPMRKPGDDEAAAFDLLNGMTLAPFQQFTQMCHPDAEGKLPEGRYPICRRAAKVLIDHGRTQVEPVVGLRALERLAIGEKLTDDAKRAAEQVESVEAAGKFVWQSIQKFPPVTDLDGERLVRYFADLTRHGERRATELALERAGKSLADFKTTK